MQMPKLPFCWLEDTDLFIYLLKTSVYIHHHEILFHIEYEIKETLDFFFITFLLFLKPKNLTLFYYNSTNSSSFFFSLTW